MKSNQMKLLGSSAALILFGAILIQGCSSSDDSSGGTSGSGGATGGKGGSSSTAGKGGTSTGGTSSGTAGKGGTSSGTAGTSAQGGAAAGDTGTTPGGADNGGATSAEAGAAGAAAGDARDCVQFCADEQATCTFGAADAAPYANNAACMSACAGFALGNVGVYPAGDMTGDSYACRRWHLSKAAEAGLAATHCPHTARVSKTTYTGNTAGPCTGAIPAP